MTRFHNTSTFALIILATLSSVDAAEFEVSGPAAIPILLVILAIITLASCACCSCCPLYSSLCCAPKREEQRNTSRNTTSPTVTTSPATGGPIRVPADDDSDVEKGETTNVAKTVKSSDTESDTAATPDCGFCGLPGCIFCGVPAWNEE